VLHRNPAAPPAPRGRQQAGATEPEHEQHPVPREHLLESPGRQPAKTADLLGQILEAGDDGQSHDGAEGHPRAAEDHCHEELEREHGPVGRRIGDLGQLDAQSTGEPCDRSGRGEDAQAGAGDGHAEADGRRRMIAAGCENQARPPRRKDRQGKDGERDERDPNEVMTSRSDRVAENARLGEHETLRSA
jgi:hypothetical protein